MARYVLLEHDWPAPHLDLLLEQGPVLRGWRLAEPLRVGTQVATASADHRLLYLDYEGPVSGGRGTVRRLDRGEFTGELAERTFELTFSGQILKGRLRFEREDTGGWNLSWQPSA